MTRDMWGQFYDSIPERFEPVTVPVSVEFAEKFRDWATRRYPLSDDRPFGEGL